MTRKHLAAECIMDGCPTRPRALGFCNKHYIRYRQGRPLADLTKSQKFWLKVDKTEECWLWTGTVNNYGYGIFITSRTWRTGAHRFAYEDAVGKIPDGMEIDHKCHQRACVNPSHLRLATRKQNCENLSGPQSNSSTGIRGVRYDKRRKNWVAVVMHHSKSNWIGAFSSPGDAEAAAIEARNKLFTHNIVDREMTAATSN